MHFHAPASFRFARAAATLLALAAAASSQSVADAARCRLERTPTLPQAISSFGACRSEGWLYVFGGHIGREHAHSRDNAVGTFARLNLADGCSWQLLPDGPALQGTALVAAADGTLLRIGGLAAHNEPGAHADLHSTASVARFHALRGAWEDATPLPEARSSHDAFVVGDRVYVAGGWRLAGGDDGEWLTTAWSADLREWPLRWETLPPLPHARRAAALAATRGGLVLIGGMDENGPLATSVVLDLERRTWSDGPELPGVGFGTAAASVGERVYTTVRDGRVLAWDGVATKWTTVAQLATPRFFHRLVAIGDGRLLALGGAGAGHLRGAEFVAVQPEPAKHFEEIVMPAPSRIRYRQALLRSGDTLWAFGGNRDRGSDRFAAREFADEIWRIDLASRTATIAGKLPAPVQSMASCSVSGREGVLLGGLGVPAGGASAEGGERAQRAQSSTAAWRWDAREAKLAPLATLPSARTQCAVVPHGGRLWLLGGTDFTPDGDGGSTSGDGCMVWSCDPAAAQPQFAPAELRLPRPRRSFGTAVLGDELFLIGGLGEGFAPAGPVDVYDFAKGRWRELELPRAWVSPQVAAIGERIYVACGGTMTGQRFTEDRSVWSWSRDEGWREIVAELPFAVRHVQMLAMRNRLVFYAANDGDDRIVVRTFAPDSGVQVLEAVARH